MEKKYGKKISEKILSISRKIYTPQRIKEVRRWKQDKGDQTMRLDYNLNKNSIVFDIGGYVGDWASDIFTKYACNIHIFEPIPDFYNKTKERFPNNEKIIINRVGLGDQNKTIKMSNNYDSSSIFKKNLRNKIDVRIINIIDYIQNKKINKIDLMKINIEGGEYDILKHLIETGYIKNVNNIQVQFHDFVPNSKNRTHLIQKDLEITHKLTYQYDFVWENWQLKNDNNKP